jgi:hypothetical protein
MSRPRLRRGSVAVLVLAAALMPRCECVRRGGEVPVCNESGVVQCSIEGPSLSHDRSSRHVVASTAGWSLKPLMGESISNAASVRPMPRQQLNTRYSLPPQSRNLSSSPMRALLQQTSDAVPAGVVDECMRSPRPEPLSAANVTADTDPCHFGSSEERWDQSCKNPDFCGFSFCFFSSQTRTCSFCPTQKQCTSTAAVQCAQR